MSIGAVFALPLVAQAGTADEERFVRAQPVAQPERDEPVTIDYAAFSTGTVQQSVDPLPDAVVLTLQGAVIAVPPPVPRTVELPLPDRQRLSHSLGLVEDGWFDPHHFDTYAHGKALGARAAAILPIRGDDWFFEANLISDTVAEARSHPVPAGIDAAPGSQDFAISGEGANVRVSQTFLAGFALFKGHSAEVPPDVEYRVTLALNANYENVPERGLLLSDPARPSRRSDHFLGLQEAFLEKRLTPASSGGDWSALRVGIQDFNADFRGFLFNDSQLGVRFHGSRGAGRTRYNLGGFWRLDKDTNSGLNAVLKTPRDDFLLLANVYREGLLIPGLTSQFTLAWNANREGDTPKIDDNRFPIRPALLGESAPRNYDVVYLGYNADGRFGRLGLNASFYGALGQQRFLSAAENDTDIRAYFGALELAYHGDGMRFRLSGAIASGDSNPGDGRAGGFDAVFENPRFAGEDSSHWVRQEILLAAGERKVALSSRNGLLPSLRSSKDQGQSNFENPGLMLVGAGVDFDLASSVRLSADANRLWFEDASSLSQLRGDAQGSKDIGWDLSASAIWRPRANRNVAFRLTAAALLPGEGFRELFPAQQRKDAYLSVLGSLTVTV